MQLIEQQVLGDTTLGKATPEQRWEADYRQAVIRELDHVDLFGADIPAEAKRNLLTDAFVTLNINQKVRTRSVRSSMSGKALAAGGIARPAASALPLTESAEAGAWRVAQRRLYEHLCASTPDKPNATLDDLQPLYQAVAHGCHAGLPQEACDTVYHDRIQRGREAYSTNKLGAIGSDLGAIACFFETPWSRLSPALSEVWRNESLWRDAAVARLPEREHSDGRAAPQAWC